MGVKILSFLLRQLTEEFKEKTLKNNLSNIEYQSYILPNNNLNYFNFELFWGEGVRFPEKVMSHYIQYKLWPCIEQLTLYRQNYRQTDKQSQF